MLKALWKCITMEHQVDSWELSYFIFTKIFATWKKLVCSSLRICHSLYCYKHSVKIRIYLYWDLEDERWHRKKSLLKSLWYFHILYAGFWLQNTPKTCSVFLNYSFHARETVTTAWIFRYFASRNVNRQPSNNINLKITCFDAALTLFLVLNPNCNKF